MNVKKIAVAAIAASSLVGSGAMAAAPATVADLAGSVSFADVSLAILAISGVIMNLYVVWKGAKFALRTVKGA
jgi:hypothetical protein